MDNNLKEKLKTKKILAITPARGGSKALPRKKIRSILDKPLIAYTISAAIQSEYIDRFVVSTEDREIAHVSESFGAEVIRRPKELAEDSSSTADVILHVLEVLKSDGAEYDYVMVLQCTSPLRTVNHINEAVELFMENENRINTLISVTPLEHPVEWNRIINNNGLLQSYIDYNSGQQHQRQSFQQIYRLNGAIEIYKKVSIKKDMELNMDGASQYLPYIMDNAASIDIDSEWDLKLVESILNINL
jgi:N-acylneuraminate cytidylyltransferase/CMP-N,N'-diacetyllegionaminic acid synthase